MFFIAAFSVRGGTDSWYLPVASGSRVFVKEIQLTGIGGFGLMRKARPGIPAHFHTGIDIKRPSRNYIDEPVFPACAGEVISIRDDGPFAQVIIAHPGTDSPVWTVYEHIAGITCRLGDRVTPFTRIARFFNDQELALYGSHFDHIHFEILYTAPQKIAHTTELPSRRYSTFALNCYTRAELMERYHDPEVFITGNVYCGV